MLGSAVSSNPWQGHGTVLENDVFLVWQSPQAFAQDWSTRHHIVIARGTPLCLCDTSWSVQEFKPRLDLLSQKLHGVDNVLGHQLAVHEMAGILGVGVPQVIPCFHPCPFFESYPLTCFCKGRQGRRLASVVMMVKPLNANQHCIGIQTKLRVSRVRGRVSLAAVRVPVNKEILELLHYALCKADLLKVCFQSHAWWACFNQGAYQIYNLETL